MRVLHLLDHSAPRRSDYSRRAAALLRALRQQGVQTVQLTGPAQAGHEASDEGWHVYRTDAPIRYRPQPGAATRASRWAATGALLALAGRLSQLTRLTRPNLIHVHLPSANAVAAWPVAWRAGIPLVVDAERRRQPTSAFPFPKLEGWALGAADAIATSTAGLRSSLRAEGLARVTISVIPAAPDVYSAGPGLARRLQLDGAPLLAYAGGLAPHDGIGLLLAALSAVRRRYPALRLLIAAADGGAAGLEQQLAANALRGFAVSTGPLSYRRTADLMPLADIVVFPAFDGPAWMAPSRHLLNAMALGCAVVASDISCHRDLLAHGRSGLLFEAGNAGALAQAIGNLLAQPERMVALGAAARKHVATRRSWEVAAAGYRRLYRQVLLKRDAPH